MLMLQFREAEQRTAASQQIRSQMRAAGYRLLGSGADATVWAKRDATGVVKIIMPDTGQGSTTAEYFERFYEFCKAHPEFVNLPRFSELRKFKINGVEYTAAVMERLKPIKSGSFNEAMAWILSDLASTDVSWAKASNTIKNPQTWQNYPGTADPKQIQDLFDGMSQQQQQSFARLYELMRLLWKTGRINSLGWDLHTENIMQRGDGTLVIVDPWFSSQAL